MQWNCNHISAKVGELESFMEENGVDVAAIQETKLRAEDSTPVFRGYDCVRRDRRRGGATKWTRGGGLALFFKKGLRYQMLPVGEIEEDTVGSMEVQGAEIIRGDGSVVSVYNVYIPKCVDEVARRQLYKLRSAPSAIVLGDVNAHADLWDNLIARDSRGDIITDWLENNSMVVLNNGDPTRRESGTGRLSTPDISVVHEEAAGSYEWSVVKKLSSDHFPILISLGGTRGQERRRKVYAWDWQRANWQAYREHLDELVREANLLSITEVKCLEEAVREVILRAARRHIGLKVLRTGNGVVLNEEVRQEISIRDQMRGDETVEEAHLVRQEEKVREVVKAKREESWKLELQKNSSMEKMWCVLKRLKGGKDRNDDGKILCHNGKGYASDLAKANAFGSEYAAVSKLKIPKEKRGVKKATSRLRQGLVEEEPEITEAEVRLALGELAGNKAAGQDYIHPRLLKEMSDGSVGVLTRLFNMSLGSSKVPQNWRRAKIVPLLKRGKDAAAIGSYRPVSLTSVLGKLMERVLSRRLRFSLESRGILSEYQAGFRSGRSVEDQLIRLSQDISDGFEKRERTVLTLFDYAKAYDKVWRDGLLFKLAQLGISKRMFDWIRSWLCDRKGRVVVNGVEGRDRLFRQGVPQGAVLSPLLFLVYINDLTVTWPAEVRVSLFADDIAVWARANSVSAATQKVQLAADRIAEWSEEWLMTISVEKCETAVFSMDLKDAEAEPRVLVHGCELSVVKNPTFLGVVYDRRLTFSDHVRKVEQKARERLRILRAVAGVRDGFRKELLVATYKGLVRSVLEYGSPAWMPWLSKGLMERLEKVQRETARRCSGLLASTPIDAVLAEAGLATLAERAVVAAAVAYDKGLSVDLTNPRSEISRAFVRKRLRKRSWRDKAREVVTAILGSDQERKKGEDRLPPWSERVKLVCNREGRRGPDPESNLAMGMAKLQDNESFDYILYTDGSVAEDGLDGGAGVVVTTGSASEPVKVDEFVGPAGRFLSSYPAEMVAMIEAFGWLCDRKGAWKRARVVTDSMSTVMSFWKGGSATGLIGWQSKQTRYWWTWLVKVERSQSRGCPVIVD